MNREQRRVNRFTLGAEEMSAEERAAMRAAFTAAMALSGKERRRMLKTLEDIGVARGRAVQRRRSDRRTDAARRELVGARVPREAAQRYREAAKAQGLSLYAWVCAALEAAAGREGLPGGGECPGHGSA